MKWLEIALPFVARFEGCEKRRGGLVYPYLDKLANVWTRGYGRTYEITETSGPITPKEAQSELADGLTRYAASCLKLAPPLAQKPAALAAVASWSWNCGIGAFKRSRLRRAINAGNWELAAQYIRTPRTAGGVEIKGLARRRDAESALFTSPTNGARGGS